MKFIPNSDRQISYRLREEMCKAVRDSADVELKYHYDAMIKAMDKYFEDRYRSERAYYAAKMRGEV